MAAALAMVDVGEAVGVEVGDHGGVARRVGGLGHAAERAVGLLEADGELMVAIAVNKVEAPVAVEVGRGIKAGVGEVVAGEGADGIALLVIKDEAAGVRLVLHVMTHAVDRAPVAGISRRMEVGERLARRHRRREESGEHSGKAEE